jgi:hypothetical protein
MLSDEEMAQIAAEVREIFREVREEVARDMRALDEWTDQKAATMDKQ